MIIETFGHEVLVAANIDTQHDVPFVLRSNHHVPSAAHPNMERVRFDLEQIAIA